MLQANKFQVTYGGGETNVAVSLACFGNDVHFITRLPENALGDAAVNRLRSHGVNTDDILRGGDRMGAYYLEHGASIRPSKVIYDRAGSAIAGAEPGMFDWDRIFTDTDWFHITGITPALSKSMARVSLNAVMAAKKKDVRVSCDLNYRKKLWTREEARQTMTEIVKYVDVIVANEEDAADVFGIDADTTDVTSGHLDVGHYKSVADQLLKISSAKLIAITLRESISASDNNWSAMLYDGNAFYQSRKYPIHLVDRVGGGDSFGAGLIHGLVNNWNLQQALEYAVAASGLKQTIPGDMNLVTEEEVLNIVKGDISGRVQR
jgi:2-dehydro-3-deoxygluconokinase